MCVLLKLCSLLPIFLTTVTALNNTLLTNRTFASQACINGTATQIDSTVVLGRKQQVVDEQCVNQIYNDYSNDTHTDVKKVAQGTLNCTSLNLYPGMRTFNVSVQNMTFRGTQSSFEDINHRFVWNGYLDNRGGQMSVVWDAICNASVFQLDITLLASKNGTQTVLTTRPCINSTVVNCLWTVQATSEVRPQEPPLQTKLNTTELDKDIHHLNGDRFRRRLDNNQVLMHSGRKLDDGSVIKMLYLYSTATKARYGDATIKSMIASAHTSTNQALADSGLSFRVQLLDSFVINNAGDDMVGALSDLVNGNVPDVHLLRNIYHADIVQLIVEDGSFCGYSYLMTSPSTNFEKYGYNVIYSGCLTQYSSTHEWGHVNGLDHDRPDASGSTIYNYGVGYRMCNDGSSAPSNGAIPFFRSVMSYPCANSVRVPIFSGPYVKFQNTVAGDFNTNNQYVLQQTHNTVANFRIG